MRHDKIDEAAARLAGIVPVLLCGGSGTRLWPVSRADLPKQFASFGDRPTLYQQTLARVARPEFAAPVIVTGARSRFLAAEQAQALRIDPGAVLVEPAPRNTAPAALAAALWTAREDPGALMLILPCDHHLPDADGFAEAVLRGAPAAGAGRIVTFGVAPTRAETGYGWLEPADCGQGCGPLRAFVEKPGRARAEALLAGGRHLWNMGAFLCRADVLIAAFARLAPDCLTGVRASLRHARHDLGFLRLDPVGFALAEARSLDVAIMERADNLSVVRYDGEWSDLGDWAAMARLDGAATDAASTAIDCDTTVLRAEGAGIALVGIGLKDIIAVATPDAVLVADRSRAQDVRLAVSALRARGADQADHARRVPRPWGSFEVLTEAPGFKVKRLTVLPGARLSLQSHRHRAEHWVVVAGTALAEIGAERLTLAASQSTYIPAGACHRLSNPGPGPAVLIEVQTGAYLGEDDITRYADDYARDAAE